MNKLIDIIAYISLAVAMVLLGLVIGTIAHAQPLPINLIAATRTDISNAEQVVIVEAGLARLKELKRGLRPYLNSVKFVNDDIGLNSLELDQLVRLEAWAKKYKPSKVTTLYSVPPLVSGNQNFSAGRARDTCGVGTRNNYAYVAIRSKNLQGQDRKQASVSLVAHELGHLLGASHLQQTGGFSGPKEVANIMHNNFWKFGEIPLPWVLWSTGNEVSRCLRKRASSFPIYRQ